MSKYSKREVAFLRQLFRASEQVRDEGARIARRIESNTANLADFAGIPEQVDTRVYAGACRTVHELVELAGFMAEPDRNEAEWEANVERAIKDENGAWIIPLLHS